MDVDPSVAPHPLLPSCGEEEYSLKDSPLLLLCKTMTTKKLLGRVLVVHVVEETAAWPHQLRFRFRFRFLLRDRSILPGVGGKTQCAHAGVVVVVKTRTKK